MGAYTIEERLRIIPDDSLELRSATAFAIAIVDPQNRHSYDASIFKARKILETVLRDLYEKRKGCSQKDRRLETLIQIAYQECNLPRHLKVRAEHIRELGNASVHEEIPLTSQDIHTVFSYLVDILEWYFDIPAERQSFGSSAESTGSTERIIDGERASLANQTSQNGNSVAVVPKGLRSFDRSDSNFFLSLMPGPYDDEGLPESIRFWLHRIEGRVHDDFSVGVVYGPSGGGKSSLVRAGLLPRLSDRVLVVYLEATPAGTEQSLKVSLQNKLGIGDGSSLLEILRELRGGRHLADKQKVLIVLDQFEQRLHGRMDDQDSELAQALRQCDGARVQCLLIVRDDYWTPIDRFTEALDLTLDKSRNLKRVDLFDLEHSRNVLALFGRAYGRLPTDLLSASDQAFLDAAVSLIADDGKVIPVRLSLFAEMIRNKPWTESTVRETGGAAGIGVAFLEETFNSPESHPEHKRHVDGAKRLLAALVPDHGSDIKGSMRAANELQEIAGYAGRDRDFSKLLRIMSTELKLITLTGTDGPTSSANDGLGNAVADLVHSENAASVTQYYQLTHDYLVPSLREWLTRKMRETRRGRAELQLANYAAVWQGNSIDQYLPTLKHYAKIQWLVPSIRRTQKQQQMMARASRFYATRLFIALLMLLLAGGLIYEVYGRTRAAQLIQQAELATGAVELNALTSQMKPYMRWTKSILLPLLDDESSSSSKRESAAWILRGESEKAVEYLKSQLLTAHESQSLIADEVDAIRLRRLALAGHEAEVVDDFWAVLAEDKISQRRFAAILALTQLDPPRNNDRWQKAAPAIVDTLIDNLRRITTQSKVNTPTTQSVGDAVVLIREEVEELTVLQDELLKELENYFETEEAAVLASIWFRNDPDRLSKILVRATPQQIPHLIAGMMHQPDRSVSSLNAMLADAPVIKEEAALSRFDGLVTDAFALSPKLPLAEFDSVTAYLAKQGFRPVRVRPFRHSTGMQASVVWKKDSADWKSAIGVPLDKLKLLDEQFRKDGYAPIDLGFYFEPATTSEVPLYTALWQYGADKELVIVPAVPTQQLFSSRNNSLLTPQGNLSTIFSSVDNQGVKWFGGIGSSSIPNVTLHYQNNHNRYRQNRDDLRASYLDLQLFSVDSSDQVDPKATWEAVMTELGLVPEANPDDFIIAKLEAAYHLERFDLILEEVSTRIATSQPSESVKENMAYWAATAAILKGDEQLAEKYTQIYVATKGDSARFVQAMLHLMKGEETEANDLLTSLLKEDANFNAYNVACVLSLASKQLGQRTDELRSQYASRAIEILKLWSTADYNHVAIDSDLAPLRNHKEFKELLAIRRGDLKQFVSLSKTQESANVALVDYDYFSHNEKMKEMALAGWLPISLSTIWDNTQQQYQTVSVWREPDANRQMQANERIAKLCNGLFAMDAAENVWPLLKHSSDPTLRTMILEQLAQVRPITLLTKHLDTQNDPVNLCAILSALLQLDNPERSLADFLKSELQKPLSRLVDNSSATVSNAAHRLATQLGIELTEPSGRKNNGGYITLGGRKHRMVIIPPNVELEQGSLLRPKTSKLGYQFAISATNVTGAHLNAQADDRAPVIATTYLAAMKYCRRLSESQNIPEEEMCYPKEEEIQVGMTLPVNYLERTGYRLPTLDEWRLAARSGVVTSSPWGQFEFVTGDTFQKQRFARFRNLPNALGILETLSSNGQWILEPSILDLSRIESGSIPESRESGNSVGKTFTPLAIGSQNGFQLNEDIHIESTAEFRVARTLRADTLQTAVDRSIASENRSPDPLILEDKDLGPGGRAATTRGNTSGVDFFSEEEIRVALEILKVKSLGWNETTGDARKWWLEFEKENSTRIALVLKVAKEIEARKATITDFFLAYVYSNSENIQATLHYLDYSMAMKKNQTVIEDVPVAQSQTEDPSLAEFGWDDLSKDLREWWEKNWSRSSELPEIKRAMRDQGFGLNEFYLADYSLRKGQRNDLYFAISSGNLMPMAIILASDILVRRQALHDLGLEGEKLNLVLQELLLDSEFETLRICLSLLGAPQVKTSDLLQAVMKRFESAPTKEKRFICHAILQLDEAIEEKKLVEQFLLESLANEEPDTVVWAGDCIVLNDVSSLEVLEGVQNVAKASSDKLRAKAVDWMSYTADELPGNLPLLIGMTSDHSPLVRTAVAKRIGSVTKPRELLNSIAVALKTLLNDGDLDVSFQACATIKSSIVYLEGESKVYDELIDVAIAKLKEYRESNIGQNDSREFERNMAALVQELIHNRPIQIEIAP